MFAWREPNRVARADILKEVDLPLPKGSFWRIVLKKSFLGDVRNF
jgi:hypothetical protein